MDREHAGKASSEGCENLHHFTVSLAERGSEERRTTTRALSQKLTDSF